jgi:hypothetical protein
MANELTVFSINRGQNEYEATAAAANTSHSAANDIEISVIRASSLTKEQILVQMENLRNFILRYEWPDT